MKLLIVDDDAVFARTLIRALERIGHTAIAAAEPEAALGREVAPDAPISVPNTPPSLRRLEWEHIQCILAYNDGNVSATARALGLHRRTLQRKLAKKPISE